MTIFNNFLTKTLKVKENFAGKHTHFRYFTKFTFTTSETKRDY